VEELKDIYSAENQIVKALPKLAKAAISPGLRAGFEEHLTQTKEHVARLEQIFETLGESPKGRQCKGMEGLVAGRGNDGGRSRSCGARRGTHLCGTARRALRNCGLWLRLRLHEASAIGSCLFTLDKDFRRRKEDKREAYGAIGQDQRRGCRGK
jgi:hypothetical protein